MSTTIDDPSPPVSLKRLLGEFYPGAKLSESPVGHFERQSEIPPPHRGLLDHDGHMTETVEAFYGCPVEVVVHRHHQSVDDTDSGVNWYCREITLTETSTGQTVQYGIVRLKIESLQPEVWRRIESRGTPLGRVLIENDVLRRVELKRLWQVHAGPVLVDHLGVEPGSVVLWSHGPDSLRRPTRDRVT